MLLWCLLLSSCARLTDHRVVHIIYTRPKLNLRSHHPLLLLLLPPPTSPLLRPHRPASLILPIASAPWPQDTGLSALSEKFQQGTPITEDDVRSETKGFTPAQVHSVKSRVDALNKCVRVRRTCSNPCVLGQVARGCPEQVRTRA